MPKIFMMLLAFMFAFISKVSAAATDFASALPTSLVPDGFYGVVALIFGIVVVIAGVSVVVRMIKRSM